MILRILCATVGEDVLIFLGAGSSKILGLKTMQDLTDELVKTMKAKGHSETIDDILKALRKFGLTPDFENIYTTMEALIDPEEGIRKSGAFTAYIASQGNLETTKGYPEYKEILTDFRNLIYDKCSIPRGRIENNRSAFDKLFTLTKNHTERRVLSSKTGGMDKGDIDVDIGRTVITTNYDMAVELYHRFTSTELVDGFRTTRKEYTKELDFKEYARRYVSPWLIKLHGSIWQFKQRDKIIQTIADPNSLPLKISVGEQMMIYPVGEKPILQEPYYSFYSIFKEQPWNVLIIIGYSFRDEPVNTAILERLNDPRRPETKVIIVNPKARKVIGNLGPAAKKFEEQIFQVKEPFEDNERLFKKIKIALDSINIHEYKSKVANLV